MEKTSNKRFGDILLEFKVISQDLLNTALKMQRQEKGKYLGEILVELGVPQDSINKALDRFSKRKSLGQVFLDLKILTPEQLDIALKKQKEIQNGGDHRLLGTIVVQLGYITYESLLLAFSKHFNMPIYSLNKFIPDPSLQKIIGEKFAQENKIIVLGTKPTVKLALGEPSPFLIEELQKVIRPNFTMELYLVNPLEAEICLKKMLNPVPNNCSR